MLYRFITKLKDFFRDPLEGVIEWEKLPGGQYRLTEETYRRAAELGYSAVEIEIEAAERTGAIW